MLTTVVATEAEAVDEEAVATITRMTVKAVEEVLDAAVDVAVTACPTASILKTKPKFAWAETTTTSAEVEVDEAAPVKASKRLSELPRPLTAREGSVTFSSRSATTKRLMTPKQTSLSKRRAVSRFQQQKV